MYMTPTFTPTRYFSDSRGYSQFNIYPDISGGQINVGVLYPGAIKAFHKHQKQDDLWNCIAGDIHVICITPVNHHVGQTENDINLNTCRVHHYYIGEKNPGVLRIPFGTYHGYCNLGDKQSTLLYWVTNAYDPNDPDEDRISWSVLGESIWKSENK